jgi:hypothetical protein
LFTVSKKGKEGHNLEPIISPKMLSINQYAFIDSILRVEPIIIFNSSLHTIHVHVLIPRAQREICEDTTRGDSIMEGKGKIFIRVYGYCNEPQ